MSATDCIEVIAAVTIPVALLAIIGERLWSKKGVGVRTIQFAAVAMFVPLILILALEQIVDGSVVSALVGAFVGYLFSNIGDFDRNRPAD
jgi:hypothetical protein